MDIKLVIYVSARYVIQWRSTFLKALIVPLALYSILVFFLGMDDEQSFSWLLFLATWMFHTIVAITTHRLVLLGKDAVPKWGIRLWKKREFLFTGHWLLLVLVMMLGGFLGFFPVIGTVFMLLYVIWVVARFSLVFPAIATDSFKSIKQSWKMSKTHTIPLMLITGIYPIVLGITAYLIAIIPNTEIIVILFESLINVFMIAALSVAYREVNRIKASIAQI